MRRSTAALAVAAALTAVTAARAPLGAPPLYDGIGLLEPYRYLNPPTGYTHLLKPTGQKLTLTEVHGQIPAFTVASTEVPSQIQVTGSAGLVTLPPGTTSIVASVEPVPPPAPPPAGSVIDGNTYRFQITTPSGVPLQFAPRQSVTIGIRATGSGLKPVLGIWNGTAWHTQSAEDTGTADTFVGTDVTTPGWYALLLPVGGTPASSGSPAPVIGAVVGVLGVLVVVLVFVRRRRYGRVS